MKTERTDNHNIKMRGVTMLKRAPVMPKHIKDLLGDIKKLSLQAMRLAVPALSPGVKVSTIVEARLLLPEFVSNFRYCLRGYALGLQMRIDEPLPEDIPDNVIKIGKSLTKGTPPEGHDLERIDEVILHYRQRENEVTLEYSFKNIWPGGYKQDFPDPEIILHSNIPERKGQVYRPQA